MSEVKRYMPINIPGEVDAIQYVKDQHLVVATWCGGAVRPPADDPRVLVPHISGNFTARIGDWVVRSQKDGRFRVMSDEEFKNVYQVNPLVKIDKDKVLFTGIRVINA